MKVSLSPEEFRDILLSHHPDDPRFDDDVVILFGKRICAGCLFGYPAAFVTWYFLRPAGYEAIAISILLAIISQGRRLINNRHINFLFRSIAGIALGFGVGGLIWGISTSDIFAISLIILCGLLYAYIRYCSMKSHFNV